MNIHFWLCYVVDFDMMNFKLHWMTIIGKLILKIHTGEDMGDLIFAFGLNQFLTLLNLWSRLFIFSDFLTVEFRAFCFLLIVWVRFWIISASKITSLFTTVIILSQKVKFYRSYFAFSSSVSYSFSSSKISLWLKNLSLFIVICGALCLSENTKVFSFFVVKELNLFSSFVNVWFGAILIENFENYLDATF